MTRLSGLTSGLALSAVFLLAGSYAQAGDPCGRHCEKHKRVKADVDSLKATLDWRDGEWCLGVFFKVEVEHAHSGDELDLVLTPTECGRALTDRDGQTVRLVVQMTLPADPCDDDLDFSDDVSMRLADGVMGDPHRLRVLAEVVERASSKVLDDKTTKVKVRSAPAPVAEVTEVREVPVAVYPPPPVVYASPPPVIYAAPPVVFHHSYGYGPSFGYRVGFSHRPWFGCRSAFAYRPRGIHVGVHTWRR